MYVEPLQQTLKGLFSAVSISAVHLAGMLPKNTTACTPLLQRSGPVLERGFEGGAPAAADEGHAARPGAEEDAGCPAGLSA